MSVMLLALPTVLDAMGVMDHDQVKMCQLFVLLPFITLHPWSCYRLIDSKYKVNETFGICIVNWLHFLCE